MFDILKQDLNVNDRVRLMLITGKEPEGNVVSIGDNFILLKTDDGKQNRIFDKLIGGWEVITAHVEVKSTETAHENLKLRKSLQSLIKQAVSLKNTFDATSSMITPNANIIEVNGHTCIASNDQISKIIILNKQIFENTLIEEIENFQIGEIIPVAVQYYIKKDRKTGISWTVAKPNTVSYFIDLLINALRSEENEKSLAIASVIKNGIKVKSAQLGQIIIELRKIVPDGNPIEAKKIEVKYVENKDEKKAYKSIEKVINDLLRQSEYDEALKQISIELENHSIDQKYKSSLLLKRAQIYSANNSPKLSELSYQDLIKYNEETGSPANNLSHLYTELARLQALDVDKQKAAIGSVKKALSLNPNNNFAVNLLQQFEEKTYRSETIDDLAEIEENLLMDADEDPVAISRMIDIDIKEHKFTHPEIIRNGGKPTGFIAKNIFDEAKKKRNVDFSERFPIYLEAAKAFSELNAGSYDLQEHLESVAYYSMLKGNLLYIQFRNEVIRSNGNYTKIARLRDSACSYYIESIKLLSNIEPKVLVTILGNYLRLNLASYYFINNIPTDYTKLFKDSFPENFKKAVRSGNHKIEEIAYKVIVDCGSSSFSAWNNLYNLPNGTQVLYGEFSNKKRVQHIYNILNTIENNKTTKNLKPGDFLKNTFVKRRESTKQFQNNISKFFTLDFEPQNILTIIDLWGKIIGFEKHLSFTDQETKKDIDGILELLKPYLNRNEKERVNILLQAKSLIENQLQFITENTTFYGRTFFFSQLTKWKNDIDSILKEKITQSYPKLLVDIDPPYLIETGGATSAPLIIRNIGEATAEAYILNIRCKSTVSELIVDIPIEKQSEIPSGGKIEFSFSIPNAIIEDSNAVEIKIETIAIYQKNKINSEISEFTLEKEPKSDLTYDDIPWRDGPIPSEQLFKGRKELIADLSRHYLSIEKDKPYILYGLTRTGKSSILEYLKRDLEGKRQYRKGRNPLVLTFSWDFSEAASYKRASDFWYYLLYQQTFEELEKYSKKYDFDLSSLKISENVRAKDFRTILDYMNRSDLYPIFSIDEFSFVKTLIDEGTINSAFLHTLRQHSLNELASFIFAGTYDIKQLIRDEKYGITGQLVNAIEEQISEISDSSSDELIEVIDNMLSFTPEAIEHIKFLSGKVPYFIQIICKYCGYYASENKRRVIGFPEVEKVVRILIGDTPPSSKSLVKRLSENTFQNNQFSPTDPREVNVLISSLAIFNKDRIIDPRGVGFDELQQLWARKGITAFRPKLAESINLLKEKKIITQNEDEGIPVYLFSVDLFRRWWLNHHPDLNLILSTLSEEV